MKIFALLIMLGIGMKSHAGVVTFNGVQEYRLIGPIADGMFEIDTSVSYFDFYIAAPGPINVSWSVSRDFPTFYPNDYDHYPYLSFINCCDPGGGLRFITEGEFLTGGALSQGWYQAMIYVGSSGFMFEYGDSWRINGLADSTQDYSPIPFTLQLTGDHVFKNYGQYVASTVPEPGALTLLLAGLAGLRRQFKRR